MEVPSGWVQVLRGPRSGLPQHRKEAARKSRDGLDRSVEEKEEMNDKVDDIVKKIPISDQDVYVTSVGRISKGSDKLKRREHSGGHEQEAEEDTRTRRASPRRNKPRTHRDLSRSAMEKQGAAKVQN